MRSFLIFTAAYKRRVKCHLTWALQLVGCVVRQPRALATHQRDVSGVRPPPKAIYRVGETGGHLRQVRRVDLGDVAKTGKLGAGSGAGDERFHLLGREVLRLVEDQEAVEEGAPAHEIKRADLDAIAQEVVGRRTAPV